MILRFAAAQLLDCLQQTLLQQLLLHTGGPPAAAAPRGETHHCKGLASTATVCLTLVRLLKLRFASISWRIDHTTLMMNLSV
jgi:hypothetical protein